MSRSVSARSSRASSIRTRSAEQYSYTPSSASRSASPIDRNDWFSRPTGRWNQPKSTKAGPVHTWTIPSSILKSMNLDPGYAAMACTAVVLTLAKAIYRNGCQLSSALVLNQSSSLPLDNSMLFIMALGIDDGNRQHKEAVNQRQLNGGPRTNMFTLPQAIAFVGGIHEIDFATVKNAYSNFSKAIKKVVESDALASFSQIYMIAIIQKEAILIIYDRKAKSITLIDGYTNGGTMIIASPISQLQFFCSIVLIKLFPDLATNDGIEISVIQMVDPAAKMLVKSKIFCRVAPRLSGKSATSKKSPTSERPTTSDRSATSERPAISARSATCNVM